MGSITAGPTPTKAPAHDGTAPAGALTTVFTPPASCSETAYKWYRTSTCMPSPERWRLYWSAASFYSPGICPSGMVSAATPPAFFGPPVELDETAIVCCPSGYSFSGLADRNSCYGSIPATSNTYISFITTYTTIPTLTTTITSDLKLVRSTYTAALTTVTTTTRTRSTFSTSAINSVFPVQVRWREVDLANLETHPLSPGVKPTGGSGGGGSGGSGGSGGDESNSGGGKMGAGAIAGIAIGALAGIAVIAGIIFFMLRRRRAQQNPQGVLHQEAQGYQHPPVVQVYPDPKNTPSTGSPDQWAQYHQQQQQQQQQHYQNQSPNQSYGTPSTTSPDQWLQFQALTPQQQQHLQQQQQLHYPAAAPVELGSGAERVELSSGDVSARKPVEMGTTTTAV